MPWVYRSALVGDVSDEEQGNGRPKLSVTKDGSSYYLDVYVRSPPAPVTVEFPAVQAVSIAAPVAVTGAFFPATQPVSIASTVGVTGVFWPATQPVSGPLTDAQLRASAVPVSGTFFQATQPVSIAAPVAVTGTFFPSTQTVAGTVAVSNFPATGLTDAQLRASPVPISGSPSTFCVTNTAAAAAACTLTLPAVVGQFHYITSIKITKYATVAVTGTATPILVTSTNLPGGQVWTFARAQAIGTTDTQSLELGGNPLKSSVANTATTIVCPATASVLWRVTATYYTAA